MDPPLTLDVGQERPLSTSLLDAVLAADENERIEITRDCWDCGWHEARQTRVESIDRAEGDGAAVERSELIDEIVAELAAIDSVAILEDTLDDIRQHRRRHSVAIDTDTDLSE